MNRRREKLSGEKRKKAKEIIKRIIIFLKIIVNLILFLCCYTIYFAIKTRNVEVFMFTFMVFVVSILSFLYIKVFDEWE